MPGEYYRLLGVSENFTADESSRTVCRVPDVADACDAPEYCLVGAGQVRACRRPISRDLPGLP